MISSSLNYVLKTFSPDIVELRDRACRDTIQLLAELFKYTLDALSHVGAELAILSIFYDLYVDIRV